ncbi:MAG: hypothetical protein RIE73_13895 [Coleofasciculus sp. C1-SOL-03]
MLRLYKPLPPWIYLPRSMYCVHLSSGQLQTRVFNLYDMGGVWLPRTPVWRGDVSLANVTPRYYLQHTGLTL